MPGHTVEGVTSKAMVIDLKRCVREVRENVTPMWKEVWKELAKDIAEAVAREGRKEARKAALDPLGSFLDHSNDDTDYVDRVAEADEEHATEVATSSFLSPSSSIFQSSSSAPRQVFDDREGNLAIQNRQMKKRPLASNSSSSQSSFLDDMGDDPAFKIALRAKKKRQLAKAAALSKPLSSSSSAAATSASSSSSSFSRNDDDDPVLKIARRAQKRRQLAKAAASASYSLSSNAETTPRAETGPAKLSISADRGNSVVGRSNTHDTREMEEEQEDYDPYRRTLTRPNPNFLRQSSRTAPQSAAAASLDEEKKKRSKFLASGYTCTCGSENTQRMESDERGTKAETWGSKKAENYVTISCRECGRQWQEYD